MLQLIFILYDFLFCLFNFFIKRGFFLVILYLFNFSIYYCDSSINISLCFIKIEFIF
jgi:hypothetical protein